MEGVAGLEVTHFGLDYGRCRSLKNVAGGGGSGLSPDLKSRRQPIELLSERKYWMAGWRIVLKHTPIYSFSDVRLSEVLSGRSYRIVS